MSEYSDNSDNFMHSSNTQAVNKNESKATEVSSHMLITTIGTYHVTLEFSPDNNSQAVEEIRSTLKEKYIQEDKEALQSDSLVGKEREA